MQAYLFPRVEWPSVVCLNLEVDKKKKSCWWTEHRRRKSVGYIRDVGKQQGQEERVGTGHGSGDAQLQRWG